PERSAHVWLDRQGSISGLALLWQRAADAPWRALERSIHPTVDTRVLAGEMRAWTEKRVHTLTTEQGVPLTLGVSACKHDARALAALCRAGYEASDGYNLYMARDLANLPPTPALARGFTIRPRAGEHDLGIYDRIGF
ncbi:MAG TPA: hypothetical protein VGP82_08135, partial [Ktedonobacterales bacterium]|nr:hypothetical protein [Ktedonobacterales bacterium]